jgi:ParB family transcriptional regulator, chromosome partitioning protein
MPSAPAKRVLGRGLADLIPVSGPGADSPGPAPTDLVSIGSLHPNPRQPRTHFDEAALVELADSIRANGILQPILVRPRTQGGYEIVAGERRYRAALRAGLRQIPVVVRTLTDVETLALALIENLIREDIGPLETARAFKRLMDDFGWTQEEMGSRVGKSRPAIANSLRLLELPEPILQSLEKGELSEGHARALLGDRKSRSDTEFQRRQMTTFRQVVQKKLSVRDAERLMSPTPAAQTRASEPATSDPNWKAMEDRLRAALGTRVRVNGTAEKGRIEIEFFSPEELDGLLERLTKRST